MDSLISCRAIMLWYISLLLSRTFSNPMSTTFNRNDTDRIALLAIKSQLHDPSSVTSSWNNSVPFCFWKGVKCGRRHQRVTDLDLEGQEIGGCLSPSIGNLSFLKSINLANNNFHGEIPREIGRLFRLRTLILEHNFFSGPIPNNLSYCSNLIELVAAQNDLVGEIPPDIGYLLKLEWLHIYDNYLIGEVPTSIGNLSVLQEINLGGNTLGGRIPHTLGNLRGLTRVGLGANKFTGMVPDSIYNISSLEYLYLSYNKLNGSIPFNIGLTLPNLKRYVIGINNFSGPIPDSLSNASKLEELDISDNNFIGKMLIDFSGLTNLYWINFRGNNLGSGNTSDLEFFTSLINCSKLKLLAFDDNQFGGMLPHSIANLSTTLNRIMIGLNQISGTIPPTIGSLFNLTEISMQNNYISGIIPHGIGELISLQILDLSFNKLQGSIPSSLGNLKLLNKLELYSNNLQGSIPSSLGNCQNLVVLRLGNNKLIGTVPQQILGIKTLSIALDISYNLLSGPFPLEEGNLKNLVALNISENMFSGEIPSTLGGCSSLEYLSLQGNSFSGSIPSSLSSLKSIKHLDFSFNNLSGQIPKYLQSLSFLEILNLSYNEFEGEVPTKGVFSNTTEISLIGNKRLCGGIAELHLPKCHSKGSKKSESPLLKVIIPIIASSLILSSACFIIVITRTKKSEQNSSSTNKIEDQFPTISYAELSNATNSFSHSNMIGQGSYGLVYKGMLGEDSMPVAVKVIDLQRKGAIKSFMTECGALRNIRHRNLIKIITVCSSIDFRGVDFKALVYEYMQNGSLEDWLHQQQDQLDTHNLSLLQRLNIAIDIASAVEYLHHHCQPPIVHGDLKPTNVLLDHDMVAHVSDFGLAKFLLDHPTDAALGTQSSSVGINGTVGYLAPEYGMGSEVSMLGDMYSFGILLLEMVTGRRPTDSMSSDEVTLHDFAKRSLPERVMEIVEPSLLLEVTAGNDTVENFARLHRGVRGSIEDCLIGVLRIGVLCSMESPADRMEMIDVVAKLRAIRENFLGRRTRDVRLKA